MEQQFSTPPPIVSTSVKLVHGLFFATLGVVMTLDNLNLFDPYPYLRYWPVIFIVVGALKIGDVTSRGMAIASIVARRHRRLSRHVGVERNSRQSLRPCVHHFERREVMT